MLNWIVNMVVSGVGVIVMLAFLYSYFAAAGGSKRPQYARLDRRDRESLDRRHNVRAPPRGIERRSGPRRVSDDA